MVMDWEKALFKIFGLFAGMLLCQGLWAGSVPGELKVDRGLTGDYRLVLSAANKANNQLSIEALYNLEVEGRRKLYQLSNDDDLEFVFNRIVDSFAVQALYRCDGRACGSSNLWANSIFRESRLYGRDKRQHYWVGRNAEQLMLLYCVQRGNKRNFCLLDVLGVKSGMPESQVADGQQEGAMVVVPDVTGAERVSWLRTFMLKHDSGRFYLVRNLPETVPFEQYEKDFKLYMRELQGLVVQLPQEMQDRISVQVIIGLVPGEDNKDRLALVLVKE